MEPVLENVNLSYHFGDRLRGTPTILTQFSLLEPSRDGNRMIPHVRHFHLTCYAWANVLFILFPEKNLQIWDVSEYNCAIQNYCDILLETKGIND